MTETERKHIEGNWLPTGLHRDIHMERSVGGDAGDFLGGGWKLCWHITVSPWYAIDSMVNVLHSKGAEPHLVIGGRAGTRLPVAVQMIGFNQAARALRHGTNMPETNRANCIQVEICATVGNSLREDGSDDTCSLFHLPDVELPAEVLRVAKDGGSHSDLENMIKICLREDQQLYRAYHAGVAAWTDDTYKALANLAQMIDRRVDIPRFNARTAQNTTRYSGVGWVKARGHLGHMHAPYPNDHTDPTTAFKSRKLLDLIRADRFYNL